MTKMGATAAVADFVARTRSHDLPDRAVMMAVDAITDAVGVGILGTTEESFQRLESVLRQAGDVGTSFILGRGRRGTVAGSATLNGTAIHALDFDDTAHPAYSHPSSHLLPVILSLGVHRPGLEIVTAYVVGLEVENALGRALNMTHYDRGWHATSTLGSIASAVTGARLLQLDRDGIRQAIGVAASMAGGVRANFGTMTKPLHAGLAARNGVLAAMLAREGFTSTPDGLEHSLGYLKVFSGTEEPRLEVFEELGSPFEILRPHALALKPYPSCGATHPAIEAALRVRKQVAADKVDSVVVGVNRWTPSILIYDRPVTPLEGKFSMQHCVASALLRGFVNIDTFTAATLSDPVISDLTRRVRVEVDPRVENNPEFAAIVSVRTIDGSIVEERVDLAAGKPERWFSRSALREKFLNASQVVLDAATAEQAFERLVALPDAPDLRVLLTGLTPAGLSASQGPTP